MRYIYRLEVWSRPLTNHNGHKGLCLGIGFVMAYAWESVFMMASLGSVLYVTLLNKFKMYDVKAYIRYYTLFSPYQ